MALEIPAVLIRKGFPFSHMLSLVTSSVLYLWPGMESRSQIIREQVAGGS